MRELLDCPDLLQYVKQMPLYLSIPEEPAYVVHAGLLPGTTPDENKDSDLMNLRNVVVGGDGKLVGSAAAGNGEPWASMWNGPELVVFGHDAARGLQQYPQAIGLDSGCVYGGQLSAVTLPGRKITSVAARRQYCPIKIKGRA
mmetsp:Transcript_11909/g.18672  ORF Transcript_11909/g.18672 Transcript_11909/m.18672 type:complete len:143 (+) Transcript_11909:27-455(+)